MRKVIMQFRGFQDCMTLLIPRTVYRYFSAYPFLLISFPHFLVVGFRAVDSADSCQLSSAR